MKQAVSIPAFIAQTTRITDATVYVQRAAAANVQTRFFPGLNIVFNRFTFILYIISKVEKKKNFLCIPTYSK